MTCNSSSMRRVRFISALAASSSLFMAATDVSAQTSAASAGAGPGSAQDQTNEGSGATAGASGLGEIIVTARKRAENSRDVPIAMQIISGERLQSQNITQIVDLTATVPNFQFLYAAIQPSTFIRGIGSVNNAAFEQAVGKFVDNVSYGRDQDARVPIFDIERLEVLKGPQVLAFGNSATAGALNITTRRPGNRFEADISAAYEFTNDEASIQGGVTVPLADSVSFRVAGLFQDLSKGHLFNPLKGKHEPNTRNWAIRPTLRITSEDLEVVLHGEYDRTRDFGNNLVAIAQPLRTTAQPYPEVGNTGRRSVDYSTALISSRELSGMNHRLLHSLISYHMLGGTLTSTTAHRKSRTDQQQGTPGSLNRQTLFNALFQQYNQFSQELRFNGTYGDVDLTLGGYYQRDTLHINLLQEFTLGGFGLTGAAATPFGRVGTYDQRTKNFSGFTDLTYRITDRLSVSGGFRYSRIEKVAGQAIFGTSIIPGINFHTSRADLIAGQSPTLEPIMRAITGSVPHNFAFGTLRLKENHWQPQAIVQYKITPKDMVYAKFVKGDKAGGFDFLFSQATPDLADYGPEKAESFEVGMKGLTLDNRLEYSVAAFRTTFSDLQQAATQGVILFVTNVGKARSQGVEVDLTYQPIDGLRINASGSYLDAKYLDYQGAPCGTAQLLVTPSGCTQDRSGTATQSASKWTGVFGIDYQQPISDGGLTLGGGVSVVARTRFNAGAFDDRRMDQAGFAQIDAHLDLASAGGGWKLSLFGRNLTDKQYLEYATTAPGQSTAAVGTYSRGRQLGLRLNVTMQ